jgi:peptidoglycan/xylan/chitin deacetylase (PgdA/CDA1 family)
VLDIFRDHSVAVSILGVARALEQNPALARACVARGHEIVSHGYRWIDYVDVPEDVERQHIRQAVDILTTLTGARAARLDDRPAGPNTRRLIVEAGGFPVRPRFARR